MTSVPSACCDRSLPDGPHLVFPVVTLQASTDSTRLAAAPVPEHTAATTVVDTTPATSDIAPLARLTDMLRLRRRRGRCDWWKQDWRSTGGLAPWHYTTCGQTGYGSDGERPTSCKKGLTAGRL
jgi:hypothetical protein